MRKRKAARPVLESMEDRLVLSQASAFDPAAQLRSAFSALFPTHHARPASAHHPRPEVVAHHHIPRAAHAVHHHHPAKSNSKSNSGNSLSNFFKSVFPGL